MEENKKTEELQSRREFFKQAAKKALPIIGAIALANVPLLSHAAEKVHTDCNYGCSLSCSGGCKGTCRDTCSNACRNECLTGCLYTCRGGCEGGCRFSSL